MFLSNGRTCEGKLHFEMLWRLTAFDPSLSTSLILMNNTATITIRLFARLREIVGQDQLTIPWHENLTIAELKHSLQHTYPELEPQFKAIMMARNGSYCKENQLLQPDDEIAFIPPVSGG